MSSNFGLRPGYFEYYGRRLWFRILWRLLTLLFLLFVLAGGHHFLKVQISNCVSLAVGGDCSPVSKSLVHCFGSVLNMLNLG